MVLAKRFFIIAGTAGAALLLAAALLYAGISFGRSRLGARKTWSPDPVGATYVATQLRQMDKAHAALFLAYDLENRTDLDYHLDDSSILMSKLKSDGSLSQEEPIRLSYPVFLPGRRRVRIAIELAQPFVWPAPGDPRLQDKLRDFVKQSLANTDGFVLFNQAGRLEVELPGAWPELTAANGANR
ncbi:MAG TPA: hypothetical protein VEU31_00715 [Candidatus Acidoferrales bacterium]|nr:hypothetical protein [Candidatus Acidoferrales bacterium]